ncbi:hypothetical protein ACH4PR_34830 [Streptomyces mirabilis]
MPLPISEPPNHRRVIAQVTKGREVRGREQQQPLGRDILVELDAA